MTKNALKIQAQASEASTRSKTKLCFIAHEFGLFNGHGGIAAYLFHMVRMILDHYDFEIHVMATQYKLDPSMKGRIFFHPLDGHDESITKILREIRPDFVEATEYSFLCYEAILLKALGLDFQDTTFILNHHTNTRECFVWSEGVPLSFASRGLQSIYVLEKAKFYLVDKNIAPCTFLRDYLQKNCRLEQVDVFFHVYNAELKSKAQCYKLIEGMPDIPKDSFNIFYISRFEGRKKQAFLVDQFIKLISNNKISARLFLIGNSSASEIDGQNYIDVVYRSVPHEFRQYIHFYGFMSMAQQEKIIGVADVYVMASPFENFPFSIIDVAYRGIPVMCSKYCGILDVLGETKDAMSFDPFFDNDLSDKLFAFSNLNKEERNRIASIQGSAMKEALGPKTLANKVDKLFRQKIEPVMIDVHNLGHVHVTEKGVFGLPSHPIPAHYILCGKIDAKVSAFINSLQNISSRLTNAVLVFYIDAPPLTIVEALEQGCCLAVVGAEFNSGELLHEQIIRYALMEAQMIPVKLKYAKAFSRKFYGFALQCANAVDMDTLLHG